MRSAKFEGINTKTLTSTEVSVFVLYCFSQSSISATNSAVIVWLLCGVREKG